MNERILPAKIQKISLLIKILLMCLKIIIIDIRILEDSIYISIDLLFYLPFSHSNIRVFHNSHILVRMHQLHLLL